VAVPQLQSLLIRLPNHLGDACMTLPALDRLAAAGVSLVLAGRRWAPELLAARPWPVIGLPDSRIERVRALRRARRELARGAGRTRTDALLFTNSLSSAIELRVAGLRPAGYATDGRGWLLHPAVDVPSAWHGDMHTTQYYFHLALALLGQPAAPAPAPHLPLTEAARQRAGAALARAGAGSRYVVLCPVAQGLHRGQVKCWDGFERIGRALLADGLDIVVCPGPGERDAVHAAVPQARVIEPLDLGAFGALLARSRLVIANDSGPGHLAAAVGARLIGVFGVTDPRKTRPMAAAPADRAGRSGAGARGGGGANGGAEVRIVGGKNGWPSYGEVAAAVAAALVEG
jgi:heptosyltransferase-2